MGISNAEKEFSSRRFFWPRLSLKAGDRARFHFLTTGEDEFFDGARFHQVEMEQYKKEVLCVRSHSNGEETCKLCEEGHEDLAGRFSCWVYCHDILHLGDNPDPDAPSWSQVKLGDRVVFREVVQSPLLIWMKPGRQQAWYGQFKALFIRYGTFKGRVFELRRLGSGMADTDYILSVVKEQPLSEDVVKGAESQIVSVEEIFRSTLDKAPIPAKMASEEVPWVSESLGGFSQASVEGFASAEELI